MRIHKPQRPERFSVIAYRGFDRYGVPLGEGRLLGTTLKPVRYGGKTVGWDAVFRVKQPDRHYYLQTSGKWKRVPHSRTGHGEVTFNFRVRTR